MAALILAGAAIVLASSVLVPARAFAADPAGSSVATPRRIRLMLVLDRSRRGARQEDASLGLVHDELAATGRYEVLDANGLAPSRHRPRACGEDAMCLAEEWLPVGIDQVAVLHVTASRRELDLRLTLVDLHHVAVVARGRVVTDPGDSFIRSVALLVQQVAGSAPPPAAEDQAPADDAPTPQTPPPALEPAPAAEPAPPSEPESAPPPASEPSAWGARTGERSGTEVVFGAEFGAGVWTMNLSGFTTHNPTGFDFSGYAPAFINGFNGQVRPAMNLHAGASAGGFILEATFLSSLLASGPDHDGAALGGVRAGYLLSSLLFPTVPVDLAIQVGGGYALVGGPAYDMSGGYFAVGVAAEYALTTWLSLGAFYRMVMPVLSTFDLDYATNRTEKTADFVTFLNEVGLSATFHFALRGAPGPP